MHRWIIAYFAAKTDLDTLKQTLVNLSQPLFIFHQEIKIMYAIEFETSIDKGVVHIPATFKNLYSSKKAKVIIMIEDKPQITEAKKADLIESLTSNPKHIDESVGFIQRTSQCTIRYS